MKYLKPIISIYESFPDEEIYANATIDSSFIENPGDANDSKPSGFPDIGA